MKIWIFCIGRIGARIYRMENSGLPRFFRDITKMDRIETASKLNERQFPFAELIAEEMEMVCEAGAGSRLLLCGEDWHLDEIQTRLSPSVRSRLAGIIARNLCHVSDVYLLRCVQGYLPDPAECGVS